MSKAKKGKINSSIELNNGIDVAMFVPYAIILFFIVLIGIGIIEYTTTVREVEQRKYWEEAYAKVENSKVGIQFTEIATSQLEYTNLRVACNNFIESTDIDNKADTKIDVDTKVDEKVFIDNKNENKEKETDKTMVETGPIYFENEIILRYINKEGELKLVSAMYDNEEKSKIRVLKQNDIGENRDELVIKEIKEEGKIIPEEKYLKAIGNSIEGLIVANNNEETQIAENLALHYFTSEGRKSVLDAKKTLNIKNSTVNIKCILGGKSDSSIIGKDRVFIQLELTEGTNKKIINIIVKLNSNLRIFDIDIL